MTCDNCKKENKEVAIFTKRILVSFLLKYKYVKAAYQKCLNNLEKVYKCQYNVNNVNLLL